MCVPSMFLGKRLCTLLSLYTYRTSMSPVVVRIVISMQPFLPRAIVKCNAGVVLTGILRLHQLQKGTGGLKPRLWVVHGQPGINRWQ